MKSSSVKFVYNVDCNRNGEDTNSFVFVQQRRTFSVPDRLGFMVLHFRMDRQTVDVFCCHQSLGGQLKNFEQQIITTNVLDHE